MTLRIDVRVGLSALVVAGAACNDGAPVRSVPPAEARLQAAEQGLCDAEEQARAGRFEVARSTFFDRAHAYLHELAATVTDRDPEAAAVLLEAKQRLEAILDPTLSAEGDPPAGAVVFRIVEVREALERAALAAGLPEPRCERSEG